MQNEGRLVSTRRPLQEGDGRRRIPRRADIDVNHLPHLVDRPEDVARDARYFDVGFVDRPTALHSVAMRPCCLLIQGSELLHPGEDGGGVDEDATFSQ